MPYNTFFSFHQSAWQQVMKRVILSAILLSIVTGILAQSDSVKLDARYLKHYWTDTRDILISPLKWECRDWTRFALFTTATTALLFADEPIRSFFSEHRTPALHHLTQDFFSPLGGNWSVFLSAGIYGAGLISKNNRMQSSGLMAVEGFLVGSLLARLPKYAFGRVRPDAWWGPSAFEWKGPFQGNSFPSGHTAAAFSVATVFATQYHETIWIPVLAYSMATATGMARIYENRHWASDVFAGALLGWVTGKFICRSHQQRDFSMVLSLDTKMKGVTFVHSF